MSFEAFRQWVQALAEAGWLPASLGWGFAVNALLAGLIVGPMLGSLGTLVVIRRHAFFAEAVGHAALTGVAVGILLGEPYTGPYGALFGYCILFTLGLEYLRGRTGLSADTLIGVFLSMSLALGASILLILAGRINVHILENVLFGSILTVNGTDLAVLAVVGIAVTALSAILYNRFMVSSFHPALAQVRGLPVRTLDYLFVVLVTVVTVASLKIVGAVLVGALLVIPAAAARIVARSLAGFWWLSVGIATFATLTGILIPMEFDLPVPSGAAIILVAGSCFLVCTALRALSPAFRGDTA
mgnify:CR=1 FL=1